MTETGGQNEPHGASTNAAAKTRPGWSQYVLVAASAAVLGFGAVYLTAGPEVNAPASKSVAESSAKPKTSPPQSAAASATASSTGLPTSPGKNRLSVGDMAMFAFKAPHTLPDVNFNGPDGKPVSIDTWRGKVVLLNLWATWCPPCRKEMPDLDRLQAQLGGNEFEVVAVSLDRGSDTAPRQFLNSIGVKNLRFFHDPKARLATNLKAIGMPATLLLDREGREIGRLVGPAHWGGNDAIRLVKAAIAATRSGGG